MESTCRKQLVRKMELMRLAKISKLNGRREWKGQRGYERQITIQC